MDKEKSLFSVISSLIGISLISKVLGFIREFVIAYKLGATSISDAYFLSITVAITFCGGLLAAFSTSFIPIYSKLETTNKTKSKQYINSLQSILTIFTIIIILLFFVIKEPLFSLMFNNLDMSTIGYVNQLTNIMIFYVILSGVRSVVGGFLQYNDRTSTVYFSLNVLQNIIIILSIIFYINNINVLGFGYLFAGIIVAIVLFISAKKDGFSYKWSWNFITPEIKETFLITTPIFINQILMDINTFFDKSIASSFGTGVVSSLNYSYKVNDIFVATFATTMATALYPRLSKIQANGDTERFNVYIKESLKKLSLIIIPLIFILFLYSNEIITILFERGQFSSSNVIVTAKCLKYYSVGMIFFAYRQILYRAMLSKQMTKKVMTNSFLIVLINIVLNIIFSKFMGYVGVALATSASSFITTILMIKSLNLINQKKDDYLYYISNIKIFLASLFSVLFFKIIYILTTNCINSEYIKFIILCIFVLMSLILNYIILYLFKEETVVQVLNKIKIMIRNMIKR